MSHESPCCRDTATTKHIYASHCICVRQWDHWTKKEAKIFLPRKYWQRAGGLSADLRLFDRKQLVQQKLHQQQQQQQLQCNYTKFTYSLAVNDFHSAVVIGSNVFVLFGFDEKTHITQRAVWLSLETYFVGPITVIMRSPCGRRMLKRQKTFKNKYWINVISMPNRIHQNCNYNNIYKICFNMTLLYSVARFCLLSPSFSVFGLGVFVSLWNLCIRTMSAQFRKCFVIVHWNVIIHIDWPNSVKHNW